MSEHALDVGLADFQQAVLEESKHRPVLVVAGQYEAGMDQLLEIVRRDRGFEDDIGRRPCWRARCTECSCVHAQGMNTASRLSYSPA